MVLEQKKELIEERKFRKDRWASKWFYRAYRISDDSKTLRIQNQTCKRCLIHSLSQVNISWNDEDGDGDDNGHDGVGDNDNYYDNDGDGDNDDDANYDLMMIVIQ